MQINRAVATVFAVGFAAGCAVALDPEKNVFGCEDDSDCGGDGYVCAHPPSAANRCCKSTGDEICDGIDNDCDGVVDNHMPSEVCNGIDDDCDGLIDEGFNLQTDDLNCGQCGNPCSSTERCELGLCKVRGELLCSDGVDNDGDGQTDCSDTDCDTQSCGTGCQCTDGFAAEIICNDTVDNNSDGGTDCADTSCAGQLCQTGASTFRCSNSGQCACGDAGTNPPAESGFAQCRDGVDNNCNGVVDCAEPGCNGISCMADAGSACTCKALTKGENNCGDLIDNDGDGKIDCDETLPDGGGDCPTGISCHTGPPRSCSYNAAMAKGECK